MKVSPLHACTGSVTLWPDGPGRGRSRAAGGLAPPFVPHRKTTRLPDRWHPPRARQPQGAHPFAGRRPRRRRVKKLKPERGMGAGVAPAPGRTSSNGLGPKQGAEGRSAALTSMKPSHHFNQTLHRNHRMQEHVCRSRTTRKSWADRLGGARPPGVSHPGTCRTSTSGGAAGADGADGLASPRFHKFTFGPRLFAVFIR
jgi:hypothetical protein